jgi:hypothetical protein
MAIPGSGNCCGYQRMHGRLKGSLRFVRNFEVVAIDPSETKLEIQILFRLF